MLNWSEGQSWAWEPYYLAPTSPIATFSVWISFGLTVILPHAKITIPDEAGCLICCVLVWFMSLRSHLYLTCDRYALLTLMLTYSSNIIDFPLQCISDMSVYQVCHWRTKARGNTYDSYVPQNWMQWWMQWWDWKLERKKSTVPVYRQYNPACAVPSYTRKRFHSLGILVFNCLT